MRLSRMSSAAGARLRRPWIAVLTTVLLLAALSLGLASRLVSTSVARADNSVVLYAQHGCTSVYAQPSDASTLLTDLLGGADVKGLGQVSNATGAWEHVAFWSGTEGYIKADALAATLPKASIEVDCEYAGVPDPSPNILAHSDGPWPVTATGTVASPAAILSRPDRNALPVTSAPLGAHLTITAWASDSAGAPWYQVTGASGSGWIWSGSIRLDTPDPITRQARGQPIWKPVAGKGMWFTNYLARHADVNTLMQAARLAGITHLYAEVAISQYGFYGRNSLDRLLPAAHAAGISVIAWVYPTLSDISADVRMTQQVAAYVTPSGDRADGIATDVEEVDDTASVYTYGQLVRMLVGPDALLVAAVYHPFAEAYYPYSSIAASWNVLAPMDYWHSRRAQQYTPEEVTRFVGNSLTTISAAATVLGGAEAMPIEELGQTYDMYSSDGAGRSAAPSGAEMTADMDAAREFGAIGVSFFEWQTATLDEWTAISQFQW